MFTFDLQLFGPAAIPIASLGLSLFSGLQASNQQRAAQSAANDAASANAAQAQATAGQEQSLARDIANGPDMGALVNAGRSSIESLKANEGGAPNLGALIMQLFGKNQQNAMETSANTHTSNLNTAAGILGSTRAGYQSLGQDAAKTAATIGANRTNPWTSAIAGGINLAQKKPNSSVATGPGGQTGGDIVTPSMPSILGSNGVPNLNTAGADLSGLPDLASLGIK